MADFPAMPLFTDAYLADTRHLTTEEHGAYLLLMMEAWRRPECSLPDDDVLLARLSGLTPSRWKEVRPVIIAFWKRDGRKKSLTQKRLLRERAFVAQKSASQRDKAVTRWSEKKIADAMALPKRCPADAPTPTPFKKERGGGGSAGARERDPDLPKAEPTFRERILAACRVDPSGITGPSAKQIGGQADMANAARWTGPEMGLTEAEVIAEITAIRDAMAEPPSALRYFDQPMARLVAAKNAPPPAIPEISQPPRANGYHSPQPIKVYPRTPQQIAAAKATQ